MIKPKRATKEECYIGLKNKNDSNAILGRSRLCSVEHIKAKKLPVTQLLILLCQHVEKQGGSMPDPVQKWWAVAQRRIK